MATIKKIYITTPIYYASGNPHIGHAYTTVLADVIAKYKKLLGYDVCFTTGMDEHGLKIEQLAEENSMTPQEFVDENAIKFLNLWKKLNINYDKFIRTTNLKHVSLVTKIFSELLEKKVIYIGNWKGLYCVGCEENYTEKDAVLKDGQLYCKVGHKLVEKNEECYFLKVSEFKKWLISFYKKHPNFIYPKHRLTELKNNFINAKGGLTDLAITRTSFTWGIPVKENKKHVVYVWIDALISYLSALNYLDEDNTTFLKYWENKESQRIHLMSKEITRFHGIYWPIILNVLGLEQPSLIISHGWIVTPEGKMSKSLGNVIDPIDYINEFGSDALRYYLVKELSVENDGIFSRENFINTFNSDLANSYGNLISRTIGMLNKYNDGVIPSIDLNDCNKKQEKLIKEISEITKEIVSNIEAYKVNGVCNSIMKIIELSSKFVETTKPWELYKDKKTKPLNLFLNLMVNICIVVTILLEPIIPDACSRAKQQLNLPENKCHLKDARKIITDFSNLKVNKSYPLFERIKK